jgi:hypothetical protein
MRNAKIALYVLCVAVLMTVVLVPAAGASPDRVAASGQWTWWGGEFVPGKVVAGNQLFSGWENGAWTGTFQGSSYEPFWGISFKDGSMWALITINFEGSVNGRRGSAVMQLTVNAPPADTGVAMNGRWVITSGSGGLRGLQGAGTWVFTGANDTNGFADYCGAVWLR